MWKREYRRHDKLMFGTDWQSKTARSLFRLLQAGRFRHLVERWASKIRIRKASTGMHRAWDNPTPVATARKPMPVRADGRREHYGRSNLSADQAVAVAAWRCRSAPLITADPRDHCLCPLRSTHDWVRAICWPVARRYTQDDHDVICYYSLWSVLPTPCCWSTGRKRHWCIS